MQTINDLIDFLHADKPYSTRQYIVETIVRTPDNNKGYFWEQVLAKAMKGHTEWIGGNNKGYDFTDFTDAKIATYYSRHGINSGKKEASVGIKNKVGSLRVCLCVPGSERHQVFFMLIPPQAYEPYVLGSSAIKFGLSPRGTPTGAMAMYRCDWKTVIQPYHDKMGNFSSDMHKELV